METRLVRINLVAAVAFTIGGSLFALGALFAQQSVGSTADGEHHLPRRWLLPSLGGYVSILLVVNALTVVRADTLVGMAAPHDLGWLSATVLFLGTHPLCGQPRGGVRGRSDAAPVQRLDLAARHLSVAVASSSPGHLAMLDVCGGRIRDTSPRDPLVGGRGQSVRVGAVLSRPGLAAFTKTRDLGRRSTSVWSTGARSPVRRASRSAGLSRRSQDPRARRSRAQNDPAVALFFAGISTKLPAPSLQAATLAAGCLVFSARSGGW